MQFFKYKEDRIPFLVIGTFFVIDMIYYFNVDNISLLLLWMVLCITFKGITAAWNHNHQHHNTFKQAWMNRLVEIVFGMYTGICGYAWVLHHNIGHHVNYLDQTKDESAWKNKKGERSIRWKYSLEIFFTSYYRCFKVGLKHPKVLRKFLLMTSTTLAIMVALTVYRPLPALLIIWIPSVLSLLITADSTYWHHSGLESEDHWGASRNTIDSTCFNVLTGNFGYHTAHHYRGGLHWTKLPALHEEIKHNIPEHCYLQTTPFFRTLDFIINKLSSRSFKVTSQA